MGRSVATSQGIRVEVNSFYVPERSAPPRNLYYFAYKVKISNEGTQSARLVSRHWVITDGDGDEEHVRGPGVVGEQPDIEPGESYEYTSACPLGTPRGAMRGSYQMEFENGTRFEAEIGPFSLEMPHTLH